MKRFLTAVALAAVACAANAQLTFVGGGAQPVINGYNPGGGAFVPIGGRVDATISTGAGGRLTATYLGFEALDTNTFGFSFGTGVLTNKTSAVGATIVGPVAPGNLIFSFMDLTTGISVGNGGNGGNASLIGQYAVLGTFAGNVATGAFTPFRGANNQFDLVLGFNDGLPVDGDFDDLVVGLTLTTNAVPEPETYALMLAGLGAVGFMARRRQKRSGA